MWISTPTARPLVPAFPHRVAVLGTAATSVIGWRRHQVHLDYPEPEAGNPHYQPGQGRLVGQLGAKGCYARAYGDLAVIEFCAQGGTRLAGKRDLICL